MNVPQTLIRRCVRNTGLNQILKYRGSSINVEY